MTHKTMYDYIDAKSELICFECDQQRLDSMVSDKSRHFQFLGDYFETPGKGEPPIHLTTKEERLNWFLFDSPTYVCPANVFVGDYLLNTLFENWFVVEAYAPNDIQTGFAILSLDIETPLNTCTKCGEELHLMFTGHVTINGRYIRA